MGKYGRRQRTPSAERQIDQLASVVSLVQKADRPNEEVLTEAEAQVNELLLLIDRQKQALSRMTLLLGECIDRCTCGGVGEALLVGGSEGDDAEAGAPVAEGH